MNFEHVTKHAEKTLCMLMSRHESARQNRNINVVELKYLGRTVTNQNLIHEEEKKAH
jgi:hypothetical protein